MHPPKPAVPKLIKTGGISGDFFLVSEVMIGLFSADFFRDASEGLNGRLFLDLIWRNGKRKRRKRKERRNERMKVR